MLRISIICLTITLPLFVFGYTFLQPLPGLGPSQPGWQGPLQYGLFSTYLSWLFRFMLVVAAFAAVVQIVIAGIQMIIGGASETQRTNAKSRIQDAIYGLLLALASWLILYTINPDLAKMKLTIPEVKIKAPAPSTAPPTAPPIYYTCGTGGGGYQDGPCPSGRICQLCPSGKICTVTPAGRHFCL